MERDLADRVAIPARGDHPRRGDLQRFMAGQLSPQETKAVVRHLLKGCLVCSRETRRIWGFGEESAFHDERGNLTMKEIETAQVQLREIARDLDAIRYRLRGVHASVPLSPAERDPGSDVGAPADPVSELHGSIEHFLDEIDGLILGLAEAASQDSGPQGEGK